MQKFKTSPEASEFLSEVLAGRGIVTEDEVTSTVDKIVDAIPASARAEYGDDKYVQAANFYEVWVASQTDAKTAIKVDTKKDTTKKDEPFVAPQLATEASEKLNSLIEFDTPRKLKATASTQIKRLLLDSPRLMDIKGLSGSKVAVKFADDAAAKKFLDYEKVLVDEPENKKAYQIAKAAVEGKTLVEVKFTENYGRIEGAVVLDAEGKENTFNIPKLTSYLVTEVFLQIPTGASGVGVKIDKIVKKSSNAMGSDVSNKGALVPKFVGKKVAIDGKNFETINEATTEVLEKKSVPTVLSFYINETKEGVTKKKKITLRGELTRKIPVFKRKEAFVGQGFGELSRVGIIPKTLSDEDIKKLQDTTYSILSSISQNKIDTGANFSDEINSIVKEIQKASASSSAAAANVYTE